MYSAIAQTSFLLRSQLLFGDQALWHPDAGRLTVEIRLWSIFHSMETIQVVLDSELLRATNGAAKRARVNRSSLIREALLEHLKHLRAREVEARDRQANRRRPDVAGDAAAWERVGSGPE